MSNMANSSLSHAIGGCFKTVHAHRPLAPSRLMFQPLRGNVQMATVNAHCQAAIFRNTRQGRSRATLDGRGLAEVR